MQFKKIHNNLFQLLFGKEIFIKSNDYKIGFSLHILGVSKDIKTPSHNHVPLGLHQFPHLIFLI
jgi:hypothetical protein